MTTVDGPHLHRILVVDDSTTIRRMVRASLAGLDGVTFSEAASGLEALERLSFEPVSMLVLDLNMPDIHGIEVLKFVRAHSQLKDTPVLVLTTRGDESSRAAAMEAGASVYLTKPFSPQVLASLARQMLGAGGAPPPT